MKTIETTVTIKPLNIELLELKVVGDTSLIVHAWSDKAKKEIAAKQAGKKVAREKRDPVEEYKASLYHFPSGGYGFPATAIKNAMTEAAHKDVGVPKTLIRKSLFVHGEPDENGMQLIRIDGEPVMRTDMVKIGAGTSDLRYRGEFPEWSMDVLIRYNADVMSPDTIVNMLNLAGFGVGVGEWRPEKNGQYGMFHIETK